MSTQIFKKQIPNELLFELLSKISSKTDKYFIFNKNAFKKGVFDSLFLTFMEECIPYYQLSKRKYLERKLTYNSFTTILRQICNFNRIKYTSQIKYDKSLYDIVYYIYFINE